MKRYEELALELGQSIQDGVLRPGDRLPSIRQVSGSRGVSASTVFEAYYRLEARGLIRARERSGYYVTGHADSLPPEPELDFGRLTATSVVDIDELVYAIIASSKNRDVVPLGSAFPCPALFPLRRLARALGRSAELMDPWDTVNDLSPGSPQLRRQIAQRYLADGIQVDPDEIILTNGTFEALHLCLEAVTQPGDAVVVESPSFYGALQALQRRGLKAIEVPTCPRNGINLERLGQALQMYRPAACWLMTNFQNPLGCSMPDEKKQALLAMLASYDVPLIEDDVYGELYYGERRMLPAKAFDRTGSVLHCSSFSKCLAPGYRLGWAIPGKYARKVAQLKLASSLSAAVPIQAALSAYLEKGGYSRHLRQLRQTLQQQGVAFAAAVQRYFPAGTLATRPHGGYFLWVELPEGCDAMALQQTACAQGISIAPGPMFSAQPAFNRCLRLNYGHPFTPEIEAALVTLGRLAAAQLAMAGCKGNALAQ